MIQLAFVVVGLASLATAAPTSVSSVSLTTMSEPTDALSVNGWSTVTRETDAAVSVNGLSTVTKTLTEYEDPSVSIFTRTATVSGSEVIKVDTITLGGNQEPTGVASSASASSSSGQDRTGAIAGGVVGALVVASVAVVLLMRYRNKKSTAHWRNRGIEPGRWNPDIKAAPSSPTVTPNPAAPFADSPIAPIFIRAPHRPAASEQSADPHSYSGGGNRTHRRNSSSLGSFLGHNRQQSTNLIEMDNKPASPKEQTRF